MEKQHDIGREDADRAAKADDPAGRDTEAVASAPRRADKDPRPVFDWQAILLRYLPEPTGTEHAIKRLGLR